MPTAMCTARPAFTHTYYEEFRVLKANLLRGEDRTTDERIVANMVFTDPQLDRGPHRLRSPRGRLTTSRSPRGR